jgi:hypothetical protein
VDDADGVASGYLILPEVGAVRVYSVKSSILGE